MTLSQRTHGEGFLDSIMSTPFRTLNFKIIRRVGRDCVHLVSEVKLFFILKEVESYPLLLFFFPILLSVIFVHPLLSFLILTSYKSSHFGRSFFFQTKVYETFLLI